MEFSRTEYWSGEPFPSPGDLPDPGIDSVSLHCRQILYQLSYPERECDYSLQFCSVPQTCPTLCDPMDCSTSGLSVHHQLPEFTQTHFHRVSEAIQPSHPLASPSPPAFNLPQYQGLFQWVSSLHQVAKVLQFQLQHQSFQWIFRYSRLLLKFKSHKPNFNVSK